ARSATPSNGTVTTVTAGSYSDLKTKILAAACGDVIKIPALNGGVQAVYSGDVIAPTQNCDATHYITIETDHLANLPPEGTRVNPSYAGVASLPGRPPFNPVSASVVMPKLVWTFPGHGMFDLTGVSFIRIIGLEISADCTQTGAVAFTRAIA